MCTTTAGWKVRARATSAGASPASMIWYPNLDCLRSSFSREGRALRPRPSTWWPSATASVAKRAARKPPAPVRRMRTASMST